VSWFLLLAMISAATAPTLVKKKFRHGLQPPDAQTFEFIPEPASEAFSTPRS
jgi:hypothetical protein